MSALDYAREESIKRMLRDAIAERKTKQDL